MVYELATVRPHEDSDRGLTNAERAVYVRGYYKALAVALRVMALAVERFARRTREKQRAARLVALERRRLRVEAGVAEGELLREPLDHDAQAAGDRADVIRVNFEGVVAERFVADRDEQFPAQSIDVDFQTNRPRGAHQGGHPASLHLGTFDTQPGGALESVSIFDSGGAPLSRADVGSDLAVRPEARERRRPSQKNTSKPTRRSRRG